MLSIEHFVMKVLSATSGLSPDKKIGSNVEREINERARKNFAQFHR
jgi:hypothetical protein